MPNIGSLAVELTVNAGKFVDGLNAASSKASKAAHEIGESFKGLGKDISGILGQFGEMGNVIGEGLSSAGETIAKFSGQLGGISGVAGIAALGVAAVGAAAIAAAAGLTKLALEGAELVHHLDQVSQKTGISIHDLQVLEAAGGTVGVGLDQISQGFRKFDQALSGTGRSSGAASVILRQMGVTARNNTDALYQVADAFKSMEDGPRKAADAVALFGRAGLQLIPLLNKGSQGLREFEAVVDEYGPKIGKDATRANEDYLLSQQKLKLAWDSVIVSAETSFLPVITKVTTFMADATKGASDWLAKLSTLPGALEAVARASVWATPGGGVLLHTFDQAKAIANADKASNAPNTTKNATKSAHSQIGQVQDDQIQMEKEYFELAQKSGETSLQYSYAQLALMKQQQKIQDLQAAGKYSEATAAQGEIKSLEDAANIEKKRNDLRRNPVTITPGKNPASEMNADLDEQIKKQAAVAAAVNQTKNAIAVYTAEESKRGEIIKKVNDLNQEIVAQQVALRSAYKEPARQSEIAQKIQELTRFRDALDKATPDIVAKSGAIALAGQINTATQGLGQEADQLQAQAKAIHDVADAYTAGYAAIRAAEIDKSVAKEALAVRDAQKAYDDFITVHPQLAGALTEEKKNLDAATTALNRKKAAQADIIDSKLAQKITEEADAIRGDAEAWQILTDSIGKGAAARIAAEGAAARARSASNPNNSPAQVNQAGDAAEQKARQGVVSAAVEAGSQMDLVSVYKEQIALLEQAKLAYKDNATVQLLANAKEKEDLIAANHQWDQAAMSVGTFGQQAASVLNELQLDGQNFWKNFWDAGTQALSGLEDSLAKFATTGKGNFKQIAQSLEQNLVKTGIQGLVSKGAGALLGSTGLGGLIPGFGAAAADGKSEATALWVQLAKGSDLLGSLPLNNSNPAAGGIASLLPQAAGGASGGIGSLLPSLLGFLPFLADGGDVTPGKAYVVGEDHPEFFVPKTPGSIVPHMKTGGGSPQINNFHFHGVQDFDSFKRNQAQTAQQMSAVVGRSNGRR